jgi:hypothetical protein
METTQLAKQEQNGIQHAEPNPDYLLELAINKDLDVEKLTKLVELRGKIEAEKSRRLFFEAMNRFQSLVPELRKSKPVAFGETKYSYAPLSDIVRQIKEVCQECGLSYRWEISDNKEEIKVTCLITHTAGHTESTTMTAGPDDSGKKNRIQARGSAIQYLQRYTLIGALGLATADADIDGIQPEASIDDLHSAFMKYYNELVQLDPRATTYHPDNWKSFPNAKLYARATAEIKQALEHIKKR